MLVVCTANVCRSPLVQHTLGIAFAQVGPLRGIEVASGGVHAIGDQPMCAVSAEHVSVDEVGRAFAAAHRSHPLTADDVARAGIVLTAEREHRAAVARLAPGSQAKVFTWREAIALAGAAEERVAAGSAARPTDLAGLARLLHATRGTVPMVSPKPTGFLARLRRPEPEVDPLTVVDGHGRAPREHQRAVEETAAVAGVLAERIRALL